MSKVVSRSRSFIPYKTEGHLHVELIPTLRPVVIVIHPVLLVLLSLKPGIQQLALARIESQVLYVMNKSKADKPVVLC